MRLLLFTLIFIAGTNSPQDTIELLIAKGKRAFQDKKKDLALDFFNQALESDPDNLDAAYHIGAVFHYARVFDKALSFFKKTYEADSTKERYVYAYASALDHTGAHLQARNLIEKHYGAEPRESHFRNKLLPIYLRSMDWYYALKLCRVGDLWWHNADIKDKKVLLDLSSPWNGHGDIFQMVRYANYLHQAGAHVSLYLQHDLKSILSECPFIEEIVVAPFSKPKVDLTFEMTADKATLIMRSILYESSKEAPYLKANKNLLKHWATIKTDPNITVGLCFETAKMQDYFNGTIQSSPRSIPKDCICNLLSQKDISFYCLQKSDNLEPLLRYSNFIPIENLDTESGPFMDSAAIMSHLDLVITADTAIAHLAGGLGITVWLLLPYAGDFRWFEKRNDSPWYPTMKIFRQKSYGDWNSVISEIQEELAALKKS